MCDVAKPAPLPPKGDLIERFNVIMSGGHIRRYHMKRVLHPQTVGDHSGRVANLVHIVDPMCSAHVLRAALMHDTSELATGDIASPVKWGNPVLAEELRRITGDYEKRYGLRIELTEQEGHLLKWADYAEGTLFCIDEMMLGNRGMAGTFGRYLEALKEVPRQQASEVALRQRRIETDLENRGRALCSYTYVP